MKIYNTLNKKIFPLGSICAIGNFDGVHLGHQLILKKLKKEAALHKLPSVLLTFFPHPLKVLFPKKNIKLICTREQKFREIQKHSIDYLIEIPFDEIFAKIKAEEFVLEILLKKLNSKKVIVGKNFNFGYKKSGDPNLLKKLGKKYGFSVSIITPLNYKEINISSTNIRSLLFKGKIEFANEMLGRLYSIRGKVIEGMKRGKKMGVPTINLKCYNDLLLNEGVYSGYAIIGKNKKKHLSAISIGKNPTFEDQEISIEANLIDFKKDIYGKEVEIYFFSKLRKQKKFKNVKRLVENIKKDIEIVKSLKEQILYGAEK